MPTASSPGPSPFLDLALAVYLSEAAEERRVLWIGACAGAERIADAAGSLRVLDPEGARAGGRVRAGALEPGPLGLRPESFDLVVVPDLSALRPELSSRLEELSDALGTRGTLVVGTDAAGEIDYEEFFELVSDNFREVQMLGQAPFAGYAVAAFEPNGEDVTFDGSLAEEEDARPERFLAVCGQERAAVDAFAVVQVPASAWAEAALAEDRSTRGREEDLAGARLRAEELADRLRQQRREAESAHEHAEELEGLLGRRTREVDEARRALEEARDEAEEARRALDDARDELADVRATLDETRAVAHAAPGEPAGAEDDGAAEAEVLELEAKLRERASELRELHAEVKRRGTLVRDLAEELSELRTDGPRPLAPGGAKGLAPSALSPTEREAEDDEALVRARDEAAERALEAEARRNELQFRVDELEARLTELADMNVDALVGRERGLRSRVAELEEMVELASGQLELARLELEMAAEKQRATEARYADLNEQFELELVRARGAPSKSPTERGEGLEALREAYASLQGERDGLLFRLRDRERALEGRPEVAPEREDGLRERLDATLDELDRVREELEVLRAEHGQLTVRVIEAEERSVDQTAQVADLAESIAAKDALLTRLQTDLAEREQSERRALDQAGRLDKEVAELREALVAVSSQADLHADAAGRAEAVETQLGRLRELLAEREREIERARADLKDESERRRRLVASRDSALDALTETRHVLAALSLPRERTESGREITAVGMESPAANDQAGAAPDAAYTEALQREMMELEQRVARLSEELEHERAAQRGADLGAGAPTPDLRKLHQLLGDREAEVEEMRGKVTGVEREVQTLRSACTEARNGLEELLGSATASGDPLTAERIGSLLRLLNRM